MTKLHFKISTNDYDLVLMRIKQLLDELEVLYKITQLNTFSCVMNYDNCVFIYSIKYIEELNEIVLESETLEQQIFHCFFQDFRSYLIDEEDVKSIDEIFITLSQTDEFNSSTFEQFKHYLSQTPRQTLINELTSSNMEKVYQYMSRICLSNDYHASIFCLDLFLELVLFFTNKKQILTLYNTLAILMPKIINMNNFDKFHEYLGYDFYHGFIEDHVAEAFIEYKNNHYILYASENKIYLIVYDPTISNIVKYTINRREELEKLIRQSLFRVGVKPQVSLILQERKQKKAISVSQALRNLA